MFSRLKVVCFFLLALSRPIGSPLPPAPPRLDSDTSALELQRGQQFFLTIAVFGEVAVVEQPIDARFDVLATDPPAEIAPGGIQWTNVGDAEKGVTLYAQLQVSDDAAPGIVVFRASSGDVASETVVRVCCQIAPPAVRPVWRLWLPGVTKPPAVVGWRLWVAIIRR